MTEWRTLSEYQITVHNQRTGGQTQYNPSGDEPIYKKHNNRSEAENVVEKFYEKSLNYSVTNIDHKFTRSLAQALEGVPRAIVAQLAEVIATHTDNPPENEDQLLDIIDETGLPDLFVYSKDDDEFLFVEVKMESETFMDSQQPWMATFDYLPVSVARVSRKFESNSTPKEMSSEQNSPDSDLASQFQARKHEYEMRPKRGTRSSNNGTASLVTLVHYGLLSATDYDTGAIQSLNQEVLAASLAAIRDQSEDAVNRYKNHPPGKGLKKELEDEFSQKFGTESNPTPVVVRGSIGGISGDICAMLDVLGRADPLEATRRNLDGPV